MFEAQDLGELSVVTRPKENVSTRHNIEILYPDEGREHIEAMKAFRDVIDEYYGDRLDELVDDNERIIIERVYILSDDVPFIEYAVVEE